MTHDPANAGEKRGSVKQRVLHGLIRFLAMFLYLYVFLGLFLIHEAIILKEHDINFTHYGFAFVNALVLAKVMLVAEDLHLGRQFEGRPLIYPVLAKSVLFAIVFICFHVVEDTAEGMWHGKTMLASIPGFGGGGIEGVISVSVIMGVALIPFFAFNEIRRILGADALHTLIFKRGAKDFIIDFKPRA